MNIQVRNMMITASTHRYRTYLLAALLLIVAGCSDLVSEPPELERTYDTEVLPESQSYKVAEVGQGPVISVSLTNRSEYTLHYMSLPSFNITLQKWEGDEWNDRGAWYGTIAVAPWPETLESGETLTAPTLNLNKVAANRDLIDTSGDYRIHFDIYKDDNFEQLIPEGDRTSQPFRIELPD